jgi:hypothetical protein
MLLFVCAKKTPQQMGASEGERSQSPGKRLFQAAALDFAACLWPNVSGCFLPPPTALKQQLP